MTNIAVLPVTRGVSTIIDKEDEPYVCQRIWTYNGRYVISADWKNKPANIMLHRYLIRPPPDLFVDHINGDGLDNRRCNLRIVTNAQNQANTGPNANNTSGYRGVSWDTRLKKWKSSIRHKGKRFFLGYFSDAAKAAEVYDEASLKYNGEYAWLNFPIKKEGP